MKRSLIAKIAAILCIALLFETVSVGSIYAEEVEESVAAESIYADEIEEAVEETAEEPADETGAAVEEPASEESVQKKKFTVMVYDVSSDLERKYLAASRDMVEMMKGIKAGTGTNDSQVNFVVETGAVSFASEDAKTAYNAVYESKAAAASEDEKKLLKSIHDKVKFDQNERWLLTGDGVVKAANDAAITEDLRGISMTASTEGFNAELQNFIDTTVERYPADNYLLFFWNHGGGPLLGFGLDERGPGKFLNSYDIATTMAQTSLAQSGKKLAWVGYDACYMADVEVALAWEPYAMFMGGSEEAESGDGWTWDPFVEQLCADAATHSGGYTDDQLKALMTTIGTTFVDSFKGHYNNNATASFVDLSKMPDVAGKLDAYSEELLDGMEHHVLDYYSVIHEAHQQARGYGGVNPAMIDLADLVGKIDNTLEAYMAGTGKGTAHGQEKAAALRDKGEALTEAIQSAVVHEAHTDDMAGSYGLAVYFPSRDKGKVESWVSYRDMYEKEVFTKDPYTAIAGLDHYRDFVSLYLSLYVAGRQLGNDKTADELRTVWQNTLTTFGIGDIAESTESVRNLPESLYEGRLKKEALKIAKSGETYKFIRSRDNSLQFNSFEQKLVKREGDATKYFGSLPCGRYTYNAETGNMEQPLYAYGRNTWFAFESGENTVIAPIVLAETATAGGDIATEKAAVVFPAMNDGNFTLIFAVFAEGSDEGTVIGMLPYDLNAGQFNRFFSFEEMKKDDPAYDLVCNAGEYLDGMQVPFFQEEKDCIVGTVHFTDTTKVKRNVTIPEDQGYETSYFGRDIFDNFYEYGDYREDISVKVRSARDSFTKGDVIKESDITVKLLGSEGEEVKYELSEGGFKFYAVFADGRQLDLTVNDKGEFCYRDGEISVPLKAQYGMGIGLVPVYADVEVYKMIDYATERLGNSFRLGFDKSCPEGVTPVIISEIDVKFLSLKDNKEVADIELVEPSKEPVGGRIAVGDNAIEVEGTPVEWYYMEGKGKMTKVYASGAPIPFDNGSEQKVNLVESDGTGWHFYLPANIQSDEVTFYAGYEAFDPEDKGTKKVIIEPITAVEYTGKYLVTTTSTKTGSHVIGLVVRAEDGTLLKEGVDYTVSYKNNKNAADPSSKKAPTLIITGKNTYKGAKYDVKFTILPASFGNQGLTLDKGFAPLTSIRKKGLTISPTVYISGGTKVPTNFYKLRYFIDGEEKTTEDLADLYTSDQVYEVSVYAEAIEPKSGTSNYVTGSRTNAVTVYAYPKQTGKLTVNLKNTNMNYTGQTYTAEDFVYELNIRKLKAGRTPIKIDDIKSPIAYYDKALTKPVENNEFSKAGTYYIAVEVKDNRKAELNSFAPAYVAVTIDGKSLSTKAVKLASNKLTAARGNARDPEPVPVDLVISEDINDANQLRLECTTRTGETETKLINIRNLEYKDKKAVYTLKDLDNGAPGSYSITVSPAGGPYKGSRKLSYKVEMEK